MHAKLHAASAHAEIIAGLASSVQGMSRAAGDGEGRFSEQLTLCPKMPLQKPLQDAAKKSGAYLGASSPAKHLTWRHRQRLSLD